ncbi:hypothetical protein OIV83_001171 [Microbotryomycetes sp. JL201]|nr:hypothetical protein OIV83_001171 [Microbotryomycetes sp. JL201]
MTSHLISYFARRADAQAGPSISNPPRESNGYPTTRAEEFLGPQDNQGERCTDCTFCRIVAGELPAFKASCRSCTKSSPKLSATGAGGHTLVIPKRHYARISHMPDDVSAAIGAVLPKISRAICRAEDHPDYNVVSNQGYAQVVYHVHYHIVPAPKLHAQTYSQAKTGWSSVFARDELDDDDGEEISRRIRQEIESEETGLVPGPGGVKSEQIRTGSPPSGNKSRM